MSDWFSFWGGSDGQWADTSSLSSTLSSAKDLSSGMQTLKKMDTGTELLGSVANLFNIGVWKKERDIQFQKIENNVLAGQAEIFRTLSYNTDQALTYAARGNVSIGAPVLRERMKKGAQEAGLDFAMLRTNADIQRYKTDLDYVKKRKAAVTKAVGSLLKVGQMAVGSMMGGSGVATDQMQVASANNLL